MQAVIKTGGKQYKAKVGDELRVEKISADAGTKVVLDNVLLIGDDSGETIGTPNIEGAKVVCTVEKQFRDKKIIIFKKKRRQNYRRKNGHRQFLSIIKVDEIVK